MLISARLGKEYSGSEWTCVQLFPMMRPEGLWAQRQSSLIAEARAGSLARQKAEFGCGAVGWF